MRYRPALDGLRAFAVTAVVLFHATNHYRWFYRGGFLGVDVFFVISGCLITTLLLAEHDRVRKISLGGFYTRRALRLLPALVVVLVVVGAAIRVTGWRAGQPYHTSAFEALFYVANWASMQGPGALGYLTHTWSLSIEEQFYLIWPITLVLLLRRGVSRQRLLTIVLSALAVVTVGRGIAWALVGDVSNYRIFYLSTVTRADVLLAGVAVGIAVSDERLRQRMRPLGRTGAALLAAVGLVGISLVARVSAGWMWLGGATVVALLAAVLVGHVMLREDGPVTAVLTWRPIVWVGRRSYGIYLIHLPLIAFLSHENGHRMHWSGPVFVAAAIVASLAAAALSYTAIERPFLSLKNRRLAPPPAPLPREPLPAEVLPVEAPS